MLESTLPTLPANDASLALLSFLRDELPAGGTAAESRFVNSLFPLVCDRVAGRLVSVESSGADNNNSSNNSNNNNSSVVKKRTIYQHEGNAWLSMPAPLNENDPVIRLLCAPRCLSLDGSRGGAAVASDDENRSRSPAPRRSGSGVSYTPPTPSLLDAISAESKRVLIDYPLESLERNLIDCWRDAVMNNTKNNQYRSNTSLRTGGTTFGTLSGGGGGALLKKNTANHHETKDDAVRLLELLPDQPTLRMMQQSSSLTPSGQFTQHTSPIVSPFGKSFGGSPVSNNNNNITSLGRFSPKDVPNATTASNNASSEPKIRLTMIQYYFFLFIRFPLMESKNNTSSSSANKNYGRSTVVVHPQHRSSQGSLYGYLLNTYLSYYLPSSTTVNLYNANKEMRMHPDSELLLRLISQFWLSHNVPPTTERSLRSIRSENPTLRDCLDMSRVDKFKTLPSKIQNGIGATIRCLVGDLSLRESVKRTSELIQKQRTMEKAGTTAPNTKDVSEQSGTPSKPSDGTKAWCLPPAMSLIQQSLLNYIRVGLACGSIHNKDSSFHRALEVWLLWMEPWNFIVKKRMHNNAQGHTARDLVRMAANAAQHKNVEYYSHYTKPKATSKSMYNPQWEAYIASNVHFYVLPLAIFLRRAREMEFSSPAEFPRSLALVQRVLRCYPQPVVNVLNSILNARADSVTNGIVSRHNELLGSHAPPERWKLISCQMDAMNLLEEIFGQYEKRKNNMNFLDRWEASIDSLLDGSLQREEGALQTVLSQLKCLVGLPLEYSVQTETGPQQRGLLSRFFGKSSNSVKVVDAVGPDRTSDGLLTDLGRQQLAAGTRQCSPFDVHYIGDPMLAPYESHEIPALVDLAVAASNYLNHRLGFVPLSSLTGNKEDDMLTKNILEMERYNKIVFRVNLRFLADYRNVIAISFVIWVVRKLI